MNEFSENGMNMSFASLPKLGTKIEKVLKIGNIKKLDNKISFPQVFKVDCTLSILKSTQCLSVVPFF